MRLDQVRELRTDPGLEGEALLLLRDGTKVRGPAVADSAEAGGRPVVVTGQEPGPRRPVPTGSAVRLELGLL